MNGKLTSLVPDKGFGFIKGESGQDYFFHKSEFNGHFEDLVMDYSNNIKIQVTFEPLKTPKGPRATEVYRMDNGNPLASTMNH